MREKMIELPIDDAILILKEEQKQRADSYTTHLAHGGKSDPAEEVDLCALEMAISALEQTKWIPVTERLPEDSGMYIVTANDGHAHRVTFVIWQKRNKIWNLTGARSYWRVTHWMPLPEPPKE